MRSSQQIYSFAPLRLSCALCVKNELFLFVSSCLRVFVLNPHLKAQSNTARPGSFLPLIFILLLLTAPNTLLANPQQASTKTKIIQASLVLKDHATATETAKSYLLTDPDSLEIWELYITSLAHSQNPQEMMAAWNQYAKRFPNAYENKKLLEEMAWGVLLKGSNSPSPTLRAIALVGAFYSQDAKGIVLLKKHLQDHNSLVRGVTVQLSSHLRDASLCDLMLKLLKEERVWQVRLEVIKATGSMKIAAAKDELLSLIANPRSHAEEKVAAIQALVSLLDNIELSELEKLAGSHRVGLRLLACEAIAYFHLDQALNLLGNLLNDNQSEVRMAALQALGRMKSSAHVQDYSIQMATHLSDDVDPKVAITAAWLLTLHDSTQGQAALTKWLQNPHQEIYRFAAGALSATGKYGTSLMLKLLRSHPDTFVRSNVALALISQRCAITESCDQLYQHFMMDKGRWLWQDMGAYRILTSNRSQFREDSIATPEVTDQLVRLEILNLMAMMKYAHAQDAIALFLEQKSWGISGHAAALLLTECDETAVELVVDLLQHPKYQIRMQAALILSLWGRDEKSIEALQQGYLKADRQLKERILQGIGGVGALSSIPFLVDKLAEPYQTLSIMAASALLQSLYH